MAAYLDSVYEEPGASLSPGAQTDSSRKTSLFQLCLVVLLAITCYLAVSEYVVTSVEVVGSSMVPTLHNQDYYLLNRWVYYFREPERYEVVVIRDPTDQDYAVKRIIARSGETVSFKNGSVYVDGRRLREPYLKRTTETYPGPHRETTIHCGRGQFVVLGDNRGNSLDSRVYGAISRQNILGMVVY